MVKTIQRKKSIFVEQLVMSHMSVLLFKRVSGYVHNSELSETLYMEFPKEFGEACYKRLIENKLS